MTTTKPLRVSLIAIFAVLAATNASVVGQLTDQLRAIPPEQLAKEARQNGNSLRGAVLFPDKRLRCAECHLGQGNELPGPNLSRKQPEQSDAYLVRAILDPSHEIRKGFENVTIALKDGTLRSGRILEKNSSAVTLRVNGEGYPRIIVPTAEIEELVESPVSLMPEKLVDQLKDQTQFLDLVRYVMELRTTAAQGTAQPEKILPLPVQGLALLDQWNCTACHDDDRNIAAPRKHYAPALLPITRRLSPDYLRRFIESPHTTKTGTTMPDMLPPVDSDGRTQTAHAIVHYLRTLAVTGDAGEASEVSLREDESEATKRGRELFHTVGCVACHSPRNDDETELHADQSVGLGELAYTSPEALASFLENPLHSRPAGRMPNMALNHYEALDLAYYLLSLTPRPRTVTWTPDAELVRLGRKEFAQNQCAVCHGDPEQSTNAPVVSTAPPLSRLQPGEGCLSREPGAAPRFALPEVQRSAMNAALTEFGLTNRLPKKSERIQAALTALRCTSCHERDGIGGVSDHVDDFFRTTNPNLGPQGRLPPPLTGVGAKLKPRWLRNVLISGQSSRPYMKTRMPQFGVHNSEVLLDLLRESDSLPKAPLPEPASDEERKMLRDAGLKLVGSDGLNCIACHTFQEKPGQTMSAVDLSGMNERLQPDWLVHYLKNPRRFHRGTVMPSFWSDGRSARDDILEGDTDRQIAAIREWMKDGRQARTPRGLVLKPMRLVAENEAVMLRRKYPSVGKRGIGVGYPSQANLVFDAEQMRIANMWAGEFADPAGVWRSQGHGNVRPLGIEQFRFQPGPELVVSGLPAFTEGTRPPSYHFLGYNLDDKQRPRYRYRCGPVEVDDYSIDVEAENGNSGVLRRTVTLRSETTAEAVFQLRPEAELRSVSDGTFSVDKGLVITIRDAPQKPVLSNNRIEIPLIISARQPVVLVIDYQLPRSSLP